MQGRVIKTMATDGKTVIAAVLGLAMAAVTLGGCGPAPTTPEPTGPPAVEFPYVQLNQESGGEVLDKDATGINVNSIMTFGFVEGPVWAPRKGWIFSDVPKSTQYMIKDGVLSTFRMPSNKSNGNAVDNQGRLLTCEHQARRVTRTNLETMEIETIADQFDGKKLTSPNDVIVSRKTSAIYFTDPDYGTYAGFGHGEASEQAKNRVYRIDPATLEVTSLDDTFVRPNGLCFNPDETKMYIADSGSATLTDFDPNLPHHIRVFDVSADGKSLTNSTVFATFATGEGVPDGIKTDEQGRVWVSSDVGVFVYSTSGERIATITTSTVTANFAFGGPSGSDLLLTSSDSVWKIATKVKGSGLPATGVGSTMFLV